MASGWAPPASSPIQPWGRQYSVVARRRGTTGPSQASGVASTPAARRRSLYSPVAQHFRLAISSLMACTGTTANGQPRGGNFGESQIRTRQDPFIISRRLRHVSVLRDAGRDCQSRLRLRPYGCRRRLRTCGAPVAASVLWRRGPDHRFPRNRRSAPPPIDIARRGGSRSRNHRRGCAKAPRDQPL